MSSTIRQLTFLGAQKFEWREVTAPRLESDGEALVRPLAVTRCDLDLYIANGIIPLTGPFAFGHEIAGEVVSVGDSVTVVQPGDRVIVPYQISCGNCVMCRRGYTNACTSVPAFSAYGLARSCGKDWGGGLSDLVRVPYADHMLVNVPENVDMVTAAAISDNASDGYRTVAGPLAAQPGANVLIVGGLAASVGMFAVQAARALGAGRVVYTDFDDHRLVVARRLGAIAMRVDYQEQYTQLESFPIVVEAAGVPGALVFALRATAPCGICTGVSAGTGADIAVPMQSMA